MGPQGYSRQPRANDLAKRGTICDEFSTLGIPLGTCWLIIDNASVMCMQLRIRTKCREKSDQCWIESLRRLCLNSKAAGPALALLRGIVLQDRMRGVLVLNTLRMISAEAVEMRRKMRLFFTYVHMTLKLP